MDPYPVDLQFRRFQRLRRQWAIARIVCWSGVISVALNWGLLLSSEVESFKTTTFSLGAVLGFLILTGGALLRWRWHSEIMALFPPGYQHLWEDLTPLEVQELFLTELEQTQLAEADRRLCPPDPSQDDWSRETPTDDW